MSRNSKLFSLNAIVKCVAGWIDPIDDIGIVHNGRNKINVYSFFANYHCKETANLHIILKTFTLTYPTIDKFKKKKKTGPRYIVIIERFQKRPKTITKAL